MRRMLTAVDREEISRGVAESLEYKEIAARIGRDASVVSREVARHGGRQGYRARLAQQAAVVARAKPKQLKVNRLPRLSAYVRYWLRAGWSPAAIAGRLSIDFAGDHAVRVSHEAIYTWVYAQPVSMLGQELIRLRSGRTARRRAPHTAGVPPRRASLDRRTPP